MKYVFILLFTVFINNKHIETPKVVVNNTTKPTKIINKKITVPTKLQDITPILQDLSIKGKIPYAVIAAFWIEETGWGTSPLFRNYYNFGGVKGRDGNYEHYHSLQEGADNWLKRLTALRYTKLFPKDTTDWLGYIDAYHEGGYWEKNTQWRQNRIDLIIKHRLNSEKERDNK